jgi:alpha-galactosidase
LQRIAYPFGGSLVKARLVGVERKASRICIANQLSTLHWLMLRAVANVNLFILTPIQFWFQSNEVRFMKSIPRIGCSLLLAVLVLPTTASLAQSVAQTPPMGWNSWNYFAGKVDDKGIRAAADQIAASGMKDAGYVYVNIDDTWEAGRDANGVIQTNAKFPDMKALADYVHSKGLKIGIYSGPGNKTCAGYTASLGHEEQDAKTYAGWGIDYLKYDLCSFIPDVMQKQAPHDKAAQMKLMTDAYEKMGKALKSTGRPIVFSLCQYGWDAPWEWAPALGGNSWRTTGDIEARWQSIYDIASQQSGLEKYAGPGHWNDPDMPRRCWRATTCPI